MGLETIVGLALLGAGTGVSMAASSNARRDMNRSMVRSLRQQENFQRQATPIFEQSLEQGGPNVARQQMAEGAGQARDLYRQLQDLPLSSVTNPLPVDEARVQGAVQQQQNASSQLQGLNYWALQQWLKNQQAGNQLGVIGNLAGSSAANAPTLAQLAGQRSAGMAGIGSLLSTAGNLAAIYGAVQPQAGAAAMQPAPGASSGGLTNPFGSSFGIGSTFLPRPLLHGPLP